MGMSVHMRDLLLARNEQEIVASLQDIEIDKADAERQSTILLDRYLGPREDIATLRDDFLRWNVLRDETIRLVRAGKVAEVEARLRPGGVMAAQAEAVRGRLQKVDDFARKKGDQLYRAAAEQTDAINRQVAVVVTVILLLSMVIAWFMLQGVRNPLGQLTAAANAFREGALDERCPYASGNEFGALSASFNALAETVQTQMQGKERIAWIAEVML